MFLMNLDLEVHLTTPEAEVVLKINLNITYCVHNSFYLTNSKSNHINSGMQNKCITIYTAFAIVVC